LNKHTSTFGYSAGFDLLQSPLLFSNFVYIYIYIFVYIIVISVICRVGSTFNGVRFSNGGA